MQASSAVTLLKSKLSTQQSQVALIGLEKEFEYLRSLVRRTALFGESNSVLVIGPRGSGKTTLLKSVLEDIADEEKESLVTINLNGFIHTDDRQALREIAHQLKLECSVEETAPNLSFADNLQLVLNTFREGDKGNKSLLLLLEETDLLASYRNQSLLYNLLDSCQSQHTPICLIALSAKLDVVDALEKRVRSRFSGRMVHLLPARSFTEYYDIAKGLLTLEGLNEVKNRQWNGHVKRLFQEGKVEEVFRRRFQLDSSLASLKHFLYCTINQVRGEDMLDVTHFTQTQRQLSIDWCTQRLIGLSVLELSLVCAAQNLCIIYDNEPFNFEMLYREYLKISTKKSAVQQYEKAIVLKAVEQLMELELVSTESAVCSRVSIAHRPLNLAVLPEQLRNTLRRRNDCPAELTQWATGSLIAD